MCYTIILFSATNNEETLLTLSSCYSRPLYIMLLICFPTKMLLFNAPLFPLKYSVTPPKKVTKNV